MRDPATKKRECRTCAPPTEPLPRGTSERHRPALPFGRRSRCRFARSRIRRFRLAVFREAAIRRYRVDSSCLLNPTSFWGCWKYGQPFLPGYLSGRCRVRGTLAGRYVVVNGKQRDIARAAVVQEHGDAGLPTSPAIRKRSREATSLDDRVDFVAVHGHVIDSHFVHGRRLRIASGAGVPCGSSNKPMSSDHEPGIAESVLPA